MTAREIELTRRRLLGSVATVGGASAASGAGTMAVFTDSETSSDNFVQAGTLDLKLNGKDQSVTFFDNATAIGPGQGGSDSVDLLNTGSIDGTLEVTVDDVRNYENGTGHKEAEYDDDATGEGDGELQEYLWVQPEIDGTPLWDPVRIVDFPEAPFSHSTNVTVSTDRASPTTFTINWEFTDEHNEDPDQVNETQTDRVEIDLTFRLVQGDS